MSMLSEPFIHRIKGHLLHNVGRLPPQKSFFFFFFLLKFTRIGSTVFEGARGEVPHADNSPTLKKMIASGLIIIRVSVATEQKDSFSYYLSNLIKGMGWRSPKKKTCIMQSCSLGKIEISVQSK